MSAFAKVKTQYKSRDALVAALCRMGWPREQIEVHDKAQHLYGHMSDRRSQKAEVIIRRQHVAAASNDVGFEQQSDGTWSAHISDYDRSKEYGLNGRFGGKFQEKLKHSYDIEVTKELLDAEGWEYEEEVDEETGDVVFEATRW